MRKASKIKVNLKTKGEKLKQRENIVSPKVKINTKIKGEG